ncbi:MAG: sulfotransferase family protein [Myxococcota bacterium]
MPHTRPSASDWQSISAEMAERDPVFVVGCHRSGTSVLRATLGRHPAFRARGERSPETRVFAKPRRVFHVLDERGRGLLRYMLGDEEAARALLDLLGSPDHWKPGDEVHWIRLYFHFAWACRGAARGLEKTPRHVFHLDRVFDCFPRARVVIAIRHPVDVLSSLRKRRRANEAAGRWPRPGGWQHFGPDEMAEAWSAIAGIIAERTGRPDSRCHLVRYEALTADPDASLGELCRFLGEPYDRDALLEGGAEADGGSGTPDNRGPIAHNPKQWRDWLPEAEARALEDALEEPMTGLGYARYT